MNYCFLDLITAQIPERITRGELCEMCSLSCWLVVCVVSVLTDDCMSDVELVPLKCLPVQLQGALVNRRRPMVTAGDSTQL